MDPKEMKTLAVVEWYLISAIPQFNLYQQNTKDEEGFALLSAFAVRGQEFKSAHNGYQQ